MALGPLQLPPYVVLEIFDWLPTQHEHGIFNKGEWNEKTFTFDRNESCMYLVNHFKKIRLIEGVHHARRRVLKERKEKDALK